MLAAVVMVVLLPATASATPAADLAVDATADGHLTATWTLPDGVLADFVEVSIGQRTDSLGEYEPYLVFEFLPDAAATSWTSTITFPPGTYFVHVATLDLGKCGLDPNCPEEYAEKSVTVPGTPLTPTPPVLQAVGQASRHLTATWTKPDTTDSDIVEAAKAPDTYYPGGPFLAENIALFEYVASPSDTSYVSTDQLEPGTYWVHVSSLPTLDLVKCPTGVEISCLIDEFSDAEQVTIPADPSPGGGGSPVGSTGSQPKPPPVAADKVTAFRVLVAASKQRVDKLFVVASMAEAGTITAGGTVSVPSLSKVYKFKAASAAAAPGLTVILKLKLAKKALKAVKKALKRHKKIKAKLTITARDKAGNVKAESRTVALKR